MSKLAHFFLRQSVVHILLLASDLQDSTERNEAIFSNAAYTEEKKEDEATALDAEKWIQEGSCEARVSPADTQDTDVC